MSTGSSFFAELQRRNVYRAAVFYAGAAWLLVQIATQVFPFFHIPEWVVRWIVIAAVIGFPFAMAFSWFYEWTPQGIKRESEVAPEKSMTRRTGKQLDRAIIAILSLAVVLLLANNVVLHSDGTALDKSVAVLPLVNESGDPQQDYFSDGLSEELISALAQVRAIKVIGRNSSFQFRGRQQDDTASIGLKLGVATLLAGTVRKQGDQVRIVASLLKAADGSALWSQTYNRDLKDVFAVQSEIATSVATALKTALLGQPIESAGRPPSGNLDAYNAFLLGDFYAGRGTQADLRKAIEQYSTATRIDPRYALAWSALSNVWVATGSRFLSDAAARQAYAEARQAVDTALMLAPDASYAHQERSDLLLNADFDWQGALAEGRRAQQLAPDDGEANFNLAILQGTLGNTAQAIDFARRSLVDNPLIADIHHFLGKFLRGAGRLAEAEVEVRKAVELQPNAPRFHADLAAIAAQRGDRDAALLAAQQEQTGEWSDQAFAIAHAIGADRGAADAALQRLIDQHADTSAYQIAEVFALRRDADQTFAWLDRAWANRDPGIQYLLYDPFILRYRDDPRFAAYCRKVGLPTATDAKALP